MILHYSLPILKDNDNALSLLFFSNANTLIKTNIEDPTEFGYPLLWPFLKESRVCLDILVNRSPTFGRRGEPSKREWSNYHYYYYSKEEEKNQRCGLRILQAHK